jgi:transposase
VGKTRPVDPSVEQYFSEPSQAIHRQYLALRSFLFNGDSAETVAAKYGYAVNTVYTLARDFKVRLTDCAAQGTDPFFQIMKPGRKKNDADKDDEVVEAILSLRKKQLSIPDIKILLDERTRPPLNEKTTLHL